MLNLQITDHSLIDPQEKRPEIHESSVAVASVWNHVDAVDKGSNLKNGVLIKIGKGTVKDLGSKPITLTTLGLQLFK